VRIANSGWGIRPVKILGVTAGLAVSAIHVLRAEIQTNKDVDARSEGKPEAGHDELIATVRDRSNARCDPEARRDEVSQSSLRHCAMVNSAAVRLRHGNARFCDARFLLCFVLPAGNN